MAHTVHASARDLYLRRMNCLATAAHGACASRRACAAAVSATSTPGYEGDAAYRRRRLWGLGIACCWRKHHRTAETRQTFRTPAAPPTYRTGRRAAARHLAASRCDAPLLPRAQPLRTALFKTAHPILRMRGHSAAWQLRAATDLHQGVRRRGAYLTAQGSRSAGVTINVLAGQRNSQTIGRRHLLSNASHNNVFSQRTHARWPARVAARGDIKRASNHRHSL